MSNESSDNSDPTTEKEDFEKIKSFSIMWKFRFYGFFKNLKFFEPYLMVMLLENNYSFFQIGILFLIQEFFTYIFEIPSGIIADIIGPKKILMMCFGFYIASFIFYFGFFELYFGLFVPFALFGLGESFRSGAHKTMELIWMEKEGFLKYKSYIYGSTRSYSLLGSMFSSLLSILIILNIPANKFIFLITIIPYMLDFVLVSTYPKYMNYVETKKSRNFGKEFIRSFRALFRSFKNKEISKGIISSGYFDSIFKSLKDYIQPITENFMTIFLVGIAVSNENEINFYIKIMLGIMYALFYLISSFSSRNAYRFNKLFKNAKKSMDILFYFMSFTLLLCALFIWVNIPIGIIFLYLIIYVLHNIRRPITVDYLGDVMPKDQRTTLLSVDSQIKSFLVFIFAPIFGLIADNFGIPWLLFGLAIFIFLTNSLLISRKSEI